MRDRAVRDEMAMVMVLERVMRKHYTGLLNPVLTSAFAHPRLRLSGPLNPFKTEGGVRERSGENGNDGKAREEGGGHTAHSGKSASVTCAAMMGR